MLLELYIFMSIVAYVFFFLSFEYEPSPFFSAVSMITFFILAVGAGNIEKVFCFDVGGVSTCTTEAVNDMGTMIFMSMFGLLNLIYLLSNTFGWAITIARKTGM